jgi:hypothetical protein
MTTTTVMPNPVIHTYTLTSPEGDTIKVEATSLEAAEIAAVDWVGDYAEPSTRTTWETIRITDPAGWYISVRVEVEPEEPECSEDEGHRWVDGPVYGSGGGVCYRDTCSHCGLVKRVDTWATDPADGSQGHTSVEYLPAD